MPTLISHVLLQDGSSPDHSPLMRQTLLLIPWSWNPLSQIYVAREPGEVPVRNTWPLDGSGSESHPLATWGGKLHTNINAVVVCATWGVCHVGGVCHVKVCSQNDWELTLAQGCSS